MAGWWKKLSDKIRGNTEDDDAASGFQKHAVWRQPEETGLDRPILDIICVTGEFTAFSQDPEMAARAASWGGSVGDELDVATLGDSRTLACDLSYPIDPTLGDGLLYAPSVMEEKWVIALRGSTLIVARSWSGQVACTAELQIDRQAGRARIDELRVSEAAGLGVFGDPIETFDWMIRSHALGERVPLPVDEDGAALIEQTPTAAFSTFGNKATHAAIGWGQDPPTRPLRTDGRMLQAARADDIDEIHRLAKAGETVDMASPTEGFTPLHLASIRGDRDTMTALLEVGADPNIGDDRGNNPMGRVIVHGGATELLGLLDAHGGNLHATNADGFGLLHAASEVDRADAIAWLATRGLDLELRTRHGHTPLQVACALGHLAAAQALVDAGADPKARGPKGESLREIAESQGKSDAVRLIDKW